MQTLVTFLTPTASSAFLNQKPHQQRKQKTSQPYRPLTRSSASPPTIHQPPPNHLSHIFHSQQTPSSPTQPLFTLAHYEAQTLLNLLKTPTLNLGLTPISLSTLTLTPKTLTLPLPNSSHPPLNIPLQTLQKISKRNRTGAYEFHSDPNSPTSTLPPIKIATFSSTTSRALSLYPTRGGWAPTVIVGGFGMHRMKDIDPWVDSVNKVSTLDRFSGVRGRKVLDTCGGLGYTAMIVKGFGGDVVSVEVDDAMVEIQRRNPWSCGLFVGEGIRRVVGDVREVVGRGFGDGEVDFVMHDPPAMAMCGELYSEEFYRGLWRVTRVGGGLFHYIGDPNSKEGGRLFGGVKERLERAGWRDVKVEKEAYGVTAIRANTQNNR